MNDREHLPAKGPHQVSRAPRIDRLPRSIFEVDAPTLLSLGVKSAAETPQADAPCVILEPARIDMADPGNDSEPPEERDAHREPGSVFRFAPVTIQPISNPDDIPNLVRQPSVALRMAASSGARWAESVAPLAPITVDSAANPSLLAGAQPPSVEVLAEKAASPPNEKSQEGDSSPNASGRALRSDPLASNAAPLVSSRNDVTRLAIPRVPLRDSFTELDEVPSAQRTPAPPALHGPLHGYKVHFIALGALLAGGAGVWALLASQAPTPDAALGLQGVNEHATLAPEPPPATRPANTPALDVTGASAVPNTASPANAASPAIAAVPSNATVPSAASPANAAALTNAAVPAGAVETASAAAPHVTDVDADAPWQNNRPAKRRAGKHAASAKKPNDLASKSKTSKASSAAPASASEQKPRDPLGSGPVFKWGEG